MTTNTPCSESTKSTILIEAATRLAEKLPTTTTRQMLIQHLATTAGTSHIQFTIRDAFEMLECAIVCHILSSRELTEYLLAQITALYQNLPTQTVRGEVQVSRQQFSTPAPIALFAQTRAALTAGDIMLEPSAGTGLLATEAVRLGAKLHLNELDPQRRALVAGLFPAAVVTDHDGLQIASRWQGRAPSIIIMNPPFSRNADGYEDSFTALRHLHSAHKCLAPGGRLVAILPSWIDRAGRNAASLAKMIDGASIVERYALGEGCFAKHGTSIATTLLVIDKVPGLPLSNNQCISKLGELTSQPSILPRPALTPPAQEPAAVTHVFSGFTRKTKTAAHAPTQNRAIRDMAVMPVSYTALDQPAALGDQVGDYLPYRPARMTFDQAGEHPTALVESLAMGSVSPPKPHYHPLLPVRVVKEGILSAAQLETVVYAGQAHSEWLGKPSKDNAEDESITLSMRKGYFLGDGTGAGKGRQIAAVILDNWLQGRRRHIWVSKNATLLEDARRDWSAVGGIAADIQPLATWPLGKPITMAEGILFAPYATLRSAREDDSRLAQILKWATAGGTDTFDGVIAFDEAHAMGGVAGGETARGKTKGSEQGIAGVTLQDELPEARVLYASATGASNVNNLAYAVRLGLWGPETSFPTRELFITEIAAGGIAAMEVVARDLKSMGLYTARALSFGGVEYDMLEHVLSAEQIAIYDRYADAWSVIHQNMEAALEESGVIDAVTGDTLNAGAKGAARSRFESVKQRFFQQLLMSMKLPSLFPAIDGHIAEGAACVIQLVSTGEAMLDRRLADLDEDGREELDIDLSPREYLCDYLIRAFPTRQMEAYHDLEGEMRSRPMDDEDGNPVHCAEALARRDACMEELGAMPPIASALDAIVTRFGEDRVAEITGRSRRLTTAQDGRQLVQRRSARSNASETDAFMEDQKQILIFSDAGGTGRSYHASLDVPNQRRRVHFLLEPGWRADAAIQGLGRTHRTHQACPPLFRPVTTDCRGERRFISTIARRLDSLGALTRGQRQTGGQNLFDPADNLESDYAKSALEAWFRLLHRGKLKSVSFLDFQKRTGLELEGEAGELRMELPPIQRWLNRILALPIAMQNAVFDEFLGLVEQRVAKARDAGTLDLGVETIAVESLEIVSERILRTDRGGATTKLAELAITRKRKVRDFGYTESRRDWDTSAVPMKNAKSGKVALRVRQRDSLLDDGTTIQRFQLIRPSRIDHIDADALAESNWAKIDENAFARLWSAEAEDARHALDEDTLFIATGLLLPVWRKIPARMLSVVRIAAADGRSILGRVVDAGDMAALAEGMGLAAPSLSPQAMIASARSGGRIPVSGLDQLTLKTSRVAGAQRLEIIGAHAARLGWYKGKGCYTEIIGWKTRLFLPDTMAESILLSICMTNEPTVAVAA
jgi:P-loop containing NTP hydrolase pore-1/C-terminal domain on Strawberry notch homologue